MRSFLRTRLCRFVSAVTAFTMLFTTALSGVHVAYAAEAKPPAEPVETAAKPRPAPTIVRELTEKRTATTTQYLLSDGTVQAEITQVPTRFKTDDKWVDIDTSLVPADAFGGMETASTSSTVTFKAARATGAPVTLSGEGYEVGLDMLDAAEGARITIGDTTHYLDVAPAIDLEYQALRDGVKETVVLKDRSAASTFRFEVDLDGLRLQRSASGQYTLVREDGDVVFEVGSLVVFDSSTNAGGDPAYCRDAKMTVTPTSDGGAVFTYDVPRSWIDDPARVFPIKVDPTFTGPDPTADAYVSSATGYSGSGSELKCGYYDSSTGHNRSYVKFLWTTTDIPAQAYVSSADLQLYLNHQYYVSTATSVRFGKITSSWGSGTTWSTKPSATFHGTESVAGRGVWVHHEIGDVMQGWVNNYSTNYGMQVYQLEDGTQNTTHWKRFWSSDYSDTTKLPKLVVKYSNPNIDGSTIDKTVYRVGDTVTAQIHINSSLPEDINCIEATVRGVSDGSPQTVGKVQWTEGQPGADWGDQLTNIPGTGGGWVSSKDLSGITFLPTSCIENVPNDSSADDADLTFVWRIDENYGDVQDNDIDVIIKMDPSEGNETGNRWTSAVKTFDCSYDVLPSEVVKEATSTTTANDAWFVESDTNGDGKADNRNDGLASGRGSVSLGWAEVDEADSYNIYLFDGNAYRQIGASATTTWTTAGAGIYPSDTQISQITSAGANPFRSPGTGFDLRDDPTPLYAKTLGASVDNIPAYLFKIVPVWGGTQGFVSEATTVTVQLADRTRSANEAPAYTTYDLGSIAGDDAHLQLNTGAVKLSATDLAIDSYGPAAALTRTYNSLTTTPTYFGDGWRFNFEASISGSGATGTRVYTDGAGEHYLFTNSGTSNVWQAPHSMVATLTWTASNTYELVFKGGDKQVFDSTGRLIAEKDRHNSSVDYIWNGMSSVTIRAANAHSIVVSLSGGAVNQATYQAGSDTRLVTYTGRTQVAKRLSSTDTLTVLYAYDAAHRLQTVSVPGFAPGGIAALWRLYLSGAGALTEIEYPNGTSSASRETSFTLDAANRTAHVYRMARVGTATVDSRIDQLFTWDLTGRQASVVNPRVDGAPTDGTATTDYSAYGAPRRSVSAAGVVTNSVADVRGNVLLTEDASGDRALNFYSPDDDLLSSTDPRGSVTSYEYNSAGDVTKERRTLSPEESSETSRTYDTYGRVLSEAQLRDAATGERAVVEYTYSSFTSPLTTTNKQVKLSWAGTKQDLVRRSVLDSFGSATSEFDPLNREVERKAYDLSGRLISTTDASETVTHLAYDVLSNQIETSRTSPGAWADWSRTVVDPAGLELSTESYVLSGQSIAVGGTSSHIYDGSGTELKASSTGGGTSTTAFDAKGSVMATWRPGVSTDSTKTADTQVTDADGRELVSWNTSDTAPAITEYVDREDEIESVDPPGEDETTFVYDASGNQVAQAAPAFGGGSAVETSTVDLGGRVVGSKDASGVIVTTEYDLLDNPVSTSLQGTGRGTQITYNSLGWVLESVDAEGATTKYVYDATGLVAEEIVSVPQAADAITRYVYDACGREFLVVNPDGTTITTQYDRFGRELRRVETSGGGRTLHDLQATPDAMGRVAASSDSVTGVSKTWLYPSSIDGPTVVVTRQDDTTLTVVTGADGLETSRTLEVAGSNWSPLTAKVIQRDNSGRPIDVDVTRPDGKGSGPWDLIDEAGRVWWQLGGQWSTYDYDTATGLKTHEKVNDHTLPARESTYTYTIDRKLASADEDNVLTTYSYDDAGRIRSAGTKTLDYSPQTGRLTTVTVAGATTSYTYDPRGRRTSQNGPAGVATLLWDEHSDRLLEYRLDKPPFNSNDVTATFTYDASGQRQQSVVTSAGVKTTVDYTYDDIRLDRVVSTTGSETTTLTYLYDESGRPVALTAKVTGFPQVFHMSVTVDQHGSVIALMDLIMGGSNVANWGYSVWGEPKASAVGSSFYIYPDVAAKIAAVQPLRYSGYAYDDFSGLYYCSQRYYDPATMQFISSDPAQADGEESGYQYCAGDPIQQTDPTGLKLSALTREATTNLKRRIRSVAIAWAKKKIRYVYGGVYYRQSGPVSKPEDHPGLMKTDKGWVAPKGTIDCSALVQIVLHEAGVPGVPSIKTSRWATSHLKSNAGWRSTRFNRQYFDKKRHTQWQVGDILVTPYKHVVLVISDGPNPEVVESTPDGGRSDGTKRWGFFSKVNGRMREGKFNPTHAGRFFLPYTHNVLR